MRFTIGWNVGCGGVRLGGICGRILESEGKYRSVREWHKNLTCVRINISRDQKGSSSGFISYIRIKESCQRHDPARMSKSHTNESHNCPLRALQPT